MSRTAKVLASLGAVLVAVIGIGWGRAEASVSFIDPMMRAGSGSECEEVVHALRGRVAFVPNGESAAVGFHVALYSSDWQRIVRRTRTGKDGAFDLGDVPAGTYHVRYWKRGYMGFRMVVCVDPTSTRLLTLKTEAL